MYSIPALAASIAVSLGGLTTKRRFLLGTLYLGSIVLFFEIVHNIEAIFPFVFLDLLFGWLGPVAFVAVTVLLSVAFVMSARRSSTPAVQMWSTRIGVAFAMIAVAQGCALGRASSPKVAGAVVAVVPNYVVGAAQPPCKDRLLFRLVRSTGRFRAGQYLVLQYDSPPYPCKLPDEMFSGRSVWAFELRKQATRRGVLRSVLPVWDFGEPKSVDTPNGRITTVRYSNLTMLDGGRIEDLPLDGVVEEFRFGTQDYELQDR